jgi:hypothetical protein
MPIETITLHARCRDMEDVLMYRVTHHVRLEQAMVGHLELVSFRVLGRALRRAVPRIPRQPFYMGHGRLLRRTIPLLGSEGCVDRQRGFAADCTHGRLHDHPCHHADVPRNIPQTLAGLLFSVPHPGMLSSEPVCRESCYEQPSGVATTSPLYMCLCWSMPDWRTYPF